MRRGLGLSNPKPTPVGDKTAPPASPMGNPNDRHTLPAYVPTSPDNAVCVSLRGRTEKLEKTLVVELNPA